MASVGAPTHGHQASESYRGARTIAQTICMILGGALVLAGLVGFFVESSFETGANPAGDPLLGLEVNGWHNIAHLATGAILLAGIKSARAALTSLMIFAGGYLIVTIWGFADGDSVFRALAINDADNWFHLALVLVSGTAFVMAGGLAARGAEHERRAR